MSLGDYLSGADDTQGPAPAPPPPMWGCMSLSLGGGGRGRGVSSLTQAGSWELSVPRGQT